MPAVDRDAMPPAQRAAWNQLWRVLLAPGPTEEPRATDSLQARSDAGNETATDRAATGRNSRTDRSGNHA